MDGGNRAVGVWVGGASLENFESSARTLTWGFRSQPSGIAKDVQYVVFGTNIWNGKNRNPRSSRENWVNIATADFSICEITTPIYEATSLLWPDERAVGQCIYPYRFGFVERLSFKQRRVVEVLGEEGIDAMKTFLGGSDRLRSFDLDLSALNQPVRTSSGKSFSLIERFAETDSGERALVGSSNYRKSRGFVGRSSDPAYRRTVEQHAEDLAEEHMRSQGWTSVERLGKPFDLVCGKTTSEGESIEKHVEVKGASGGASAVEYTPNEVDHFRSCPYGADLIVVRDITVTGDSPDFFASGGELLHVENYRAPDDHLSPIKWQGVVPWS